MPDPDNRPEGAGSSKNREDAFLALVRANEARLRKICRVYTPSREAASDLYQDVLVELWRALPGFEGRAQESTWLYRVALNTALDHERKRTVRREAALPDAHRGAALVMAGSVLIWWTLRRARSSHDAGAEPSVAERLRAARGKVDAQIGLLESVLWWYLAPLMVGMALMALGMRGATWIGAAHVTAIALLGAAVYWLNQRAVREELRPERARLARLLRQVEEA